MTAPVLQVDGLGKRFAGGVIALDDVTVEVRPREVVGLVGQNGAGKSTLLKILAGVQRPDEGAVRVHDKPLPFGSSPASAARGIGMVFQEQSVLSNLTVAENIFLGKATPATRFGIYRWRRLYREASHQLAKINSSISPRAIVGDLSFAERQMVELAKVLALEERVTGPLVILFDEPTSVLAADEIETLFAQIRRLRLKSSVVFVSHRLEEVLSVSDRVYVMRDGRVVAEQRTEDVDTDELYRLMVGSDRASDYFRRGSVDQQQRTREGEHAVTKRLVVHGLGAGRAFQDVSFSLGAGEVLGVAGVVGSGREDLCRGLFGALPLSDGYVELDGQRVAFRSPADAIRCGVGYVPAERKLEGAVMNRSVHENMVIAGGRSAKERWLINRRRERSAVAQWMRTLGVKAPGPHVLIDQLSGGNQQKAVLGKWLVNGGLKLLILDHPTRGLDAGAKSELYEIIHGLVAAGLSVVLLSDTLEETVGLSDEILVMRDGRVSGYFTECQISPPSNDALVRLMV